MLNFLTPTFAIDKFIPIAKWLAVGVVALALVLSIVFFFIDKKDFPKTLKRILIALFAFLLLLGLTCLIMELIKSYSAEYAEENWLDRSYLIKYILIPFSALITVVLSSGITLFIVAKRSSPQTSKKNLSISAKILGAINLLGLIVCGILLALYYEAKISNDGYYNSDTASVNQLVLYLSAGLIIITITALAFILDTSKKSLDTKCIAMAGVCVAMSFGLSYIKLFELGQGGSITLFSLLPIMIFSYIYGTKKGVLVCLVYGVLQAIQDPWLIHPAQFLLDYPIAFSAIGLSGAFANISKLKNAPQIALLCGGIFASVLRFVSHVLSGVFAFSAYAEGVNPWIYSLGYNSFVFVDMAITLVVGALLFSSKSFLKELKKA